MNDDEQKYTKNIALGDDLRIYVGAGIDKETSTPTLVLVINDIEYAIPLEAGESLAYGLLEMVTLAQHDTNIIRFLQNKGLPRHAALAFVRDLHEFSNDAEELQQPSSTEFMH